MGQVGAVVIQVLAGGARAPPAMETILATVATLALDDGGPGDFHATSIAKDSSLDIGHGNLHC